MSDLMQTEAETGPQGRAPRAMVAGLCAIAFLSGSAALVFETLWFRAAGLTFGNGVWASSLVLAAFMAGLATGNALAAGRADRSPAPIRLYALLELTIGLSGAALVWLLPLGTDLLAPVLHALRDPPWLLHAVRLALAFALLMVPATAMGATLPVLVKALSGQDGRFGRVLGRLYGWNTLGAVAGALLGEALLIGWFGVRGTAACALGINGLAALGALWLARSARPARAGPAPPAAWSLSGVRLLVASALSGWVFLALEVVWFRFLSLFVYGTSLVFALMLAVVLAGIGLGGLACARWLGTPGRARPALPALALASACATLLCFVAWRVAFAAFLAPGTAAGGILHVILLTAPLVFPAALLSGVLFTAIGDAAKEELGAEARTAGLVTLANTLGAACGSLVGGFVLLPELGIERSLLLLTGGYAAVAVLVVVPSASTSRRRRAVPLAVLTGALVLLVTQFPYGVLRSVYLPHPTLPFAEEGSRIVAVKEGLVETLVYVRTDRLDRPLHFRMFTDGFSMSSTTMHSKRYMKAYVYLPVAVHPELRSALLISYGVGSTAKALVDTRSLERIDVVDISPDILETSSIVFPTPGDDPLRDSRVQVHVEDGRFFLQTADRRFDLITSEPPPPKYAGIVNLYSREYFELIRARLADGGITTYWLPVHNLTESDTRSIVGAFCQVFDDCTLWTGAGLDWMLVGSRDARGPVTREHFERQWQDPVVGPELAALGFERPEQLGATFMAGPERLRAAVGDTPPLVDDFPHRLSAEPVLPGAAHANPWFLDLLDPAAAAADFARDPTVARLWPPALRESTAEYFEWQKLVNERLAYAGQQRLGEADLHRVLTQTDLRTLPVWLLGSEVEELRIAERIRGRRERAPQVLRLRGVAALADRRFADAARLFRAARSVGAAAARLASLEIYALCMSGQLDEAAAVARGLVRSAPAARKADAYWAFLETTFGLADPRGVFGDGLSQGRGAGGPS